MLKKILIIIICLSLASLLVSCSKSSTGSSQSPTNNTITPDEGQPKFPSIGKYWVVDPDNYLNELVKKTADEVFEKLRLDENTEIVIVVQKGIVNRGPTNDEKIWAMKWGRWAKLGDRHNRLAVVWLIRPDVKPEENRVTIEISTPLYWYTAVDYGPTLEEAVEYANANDFNGAVESIVRNTDETIRKISKQKR